MSDADVERPELPSGLVLVIGALAAMWLIEVVDAVALSDRLQGGGIHPRRVDGIDGVLWAPWLHVGWRHIMSNSVPFLVLGAMVALRGTRTWLNVTAVVVVLGGGLTWLFARSGNHVGASGVVFGYLGYLVGAAWFERSFRAIGLAALAVALYGGLIFGVVPNREVSWEGHLFGALAGVVAAAMLASRSTTADPA